MPIVVRDVRAKHAADDVMRIEPGQICAVKHLIGFRHHLLDDPVQVVRSGQLQIHMGIGAGDPDAFIPFPVATMGKMAQVGCRRGLLAQASITNWLPHTGESSRIAA